MKYTSVVIGMLLGIFLLSCTPKPVLDKAILEQGDRNPDFQAMRANPEQYKGKLYVLGANIIDLKLLPTAAELEALSVPVDKYGYFEAKMRPGSRFLAVLPKDGEMMDPVDFSKGRWVTLAGEFLETRKGKIDQMDYVYPVFLIKQINLWPRETREYSDYFYPPSYYYGPWYDPWYYPYQYPYPYPYPRYHYRLTPPPAQDRRHMIQ